MDFAHDILDGLRGKVHGTAAVAETAGFDWPGLHARLVAAHAARAELSRGESRSVAGNFAMWRASAAPNGKTLPVVNPTNSADGKAPSGMESAYAGESGAGGRGYE